MNDQDVQFKLKTFKLRGLASNQVHILDWLLLKSPNLIDLEIYYSFQRSNLVGDIQLLKELTGRAQALIESIYLEMDYEISSTIFEPLS